MENFINWEALRLSWEMPGQNDSRLYQDLKQEAMDKPHRLLLCDPGIWMRTALRRGRSVFRADPGPRKRQYRQVLLADVRSADGCTRSLPLAQERSMLERALIQARDACNQQAEHHALPLLRRLTWRYQDEELVLRCNQQLRD